MMLSSLRILSCQTQRQLFTKSRICNSIITASGSSREFSTLAGRRRFYRRVGISPAPAVDNLNKGDEEYSVTLDDRPLKPPTGQPLVVPSKLLAAVLAAEWDAQSPSISPADMPLRTLVCTTLDQTIPHPQIYQDVCLKYLSTDGICYWADPTTDQRLYACQQEAWQRVHELIQQEFGVAPTSETSKGGVILQRGTLVKHEAALQDALIEWCTSLDAWQLTALHSVVTNTKSFLLGWALLTSNLSVTEAIVAARVEEEFQITKSGMVEGGHDYDRLNTSIQLHAAVVLRDCIAIDCSTNDTLPQQQQPVLLHAFHDKETPVADGKTADPAAVTKEGAAVPVEEELSETKKLFKKVKEAGIAGE
jgi:ATP synthase F1 complex assembly factor 2